jgi:hypothetical protein
MCGVPIDTAKPEQKLAQLMERELFSTVSVDPQKLKLFLLAYWDTVIALAHKIHEG